MRNYTFSIIAILRTRCAQLVCAGKAFRTSFRPTWLCSSAPTAVLTRPNEPSSCTRAVTHWTPRGPAYGLPAGRILGRECRSPSSYRPSRHQGGGGLSDALSMAGRSRHRIDQHEVARAGDAIGELLGLEGAFVQPPPELSQAEPTAAPRCRTLRTGYLAQWLCAL